MTTPVTSQGLLPVAEGSVLTDAPLAGVGQVVVARHVAPASAVVPNHDGAVLAGQEVAVGLTSVPVLIQLTGTGRDHRGGKWG